MITLRDWQRRCLDSIHFQGMLRGVRSLLWAGGCNMLVVVTPGGGKTILALEAARRLANAGRIARVVVVVPSTHLREQWGRQASLMGLELDWRFGNSSPVPVLAGDYAGCVATYQQVMAGPHIFRRMAAERPTLLILDEVHHAGDGLQWGANLHMAFDQVGLRLLLSGTPFRSDDSQIPWVSYRNGVSSADFTYGYAEAVTENVCRPLYFTPVIGEAQWRMGPGEQLREADFTMPLEERFASQRLRAALTADDQAFVRELLTAAHRRLQHYWNQGDLTAGGLCLAMDQAHAQTLAGLLREITGAAPMVVTSDDPDAHRKLATFRKSRIAWVVAVRMVSEGVDIPRLRVLAWCTNIVTELFFHQACGRIARGYADQDAHVFLPADERLLAFARGIGEERSHGLGLPDVGMPLAIVPLDTKREPSEFEALRSRGQLGQTITHPDTAGVVERKHFLRRECAARLATLVKVLERRGTGSVNHYAAVNEELNARQGVPTIDQCTVAQLEQRLALLDAKVNTAAAFQAGGAAC